MMPSPRRRPYTPSSSLPKSQQYRHPQSTLSSWISSNRNSLGKPIAETIVRAYNQAGQYRASTRRKRITIKILLFANRRRPRAVAEGGRGGESAIFFTKNEDTTTRRESRERGDYTRSRCSREDEDTHRGQLIAPSTMINSLGKAATRFASSTRVRRRRRRRGLTVYSGRHNFPDSSLGNFTKGRNSLGKLLVRVDSARWAKSTGKACKFFLGKR